MKHLLLLITLLTLSIATASGEAAPAVVFSQEVVAINADGSLLPAKEIRPDEMEGVREYDYDLGRNRLLRIQTNISNAEERGLHHVAETIRRSYDYIEAMTGRQLSQGTLIYLLEFEEVPYTYTFSATYDDASQWGEVRLALIARDTQLNDLSTPSSIADLIYDTLPHELGHAVLSDIPQLSHDISGRPSYHTRWFIEGVCEVLAKGFSRQENPALHKHFVSLRNVDEVLAEQHMVTALLGWEQHNSNSMRLESNLYGAAMLTLEVWSKRSTLDRLLAQIATSDKPLRGSDLVTMMTATTGHSPQEVFSQAHNHGTQLNATLLAQATTSQAEQ